jgi:hypothetical protein
MHTPSPWRIQQYNGAYEVICDSWDVASGSLRDTGPIRRIEDALLIAAAPDLLEALTLLLDAYSEAHALYDLGDCEGSIKARAAIDKAEGK